jgi:hypothetical protein
MIIIWRGYGFLVPLAAIVAVMLGAIINVNLKLHQPASGVVAAGALCLAGVALWFFSQRIESEPGRVFIDKATGREITVGRNAGSFFFVPTRYWAYILPGLAVVANIVYTLNPTVH